MKMFKYLSIILNDKLTLKTHRKNFKRINQKSQHKNHNCKKLNTYSKRLKEHDEEDNQIVAELLQKEVSTQIMCG